MLLTSFVLLLSASTSALAQTVYDAAHNVTPITATWSSGSMNVTTGSTYVNPLNKTFSYPTNTGISFSFYEDVGWFEVLRYRIYGNDGFQRVEDPCAARSDFTEDYNLTELYQSWQIFLDAIDGPRLHMFQFDGSPVPPMRQLSTTPNMLPTQQLRNNSQSKTQVLAALSSDSVGIPIHRWSVAAAVVVGALLGSVSLV
ncbi:chaperone for protein-folding within the ER, fungal-domain-containing protein [Russula earlei]|uniref:Chaperone for protein-folding within the ER, fungal-domain-containing protein n=1 Tax=Russula earlei TaxID=71964 RepID=A0ACC0TTU7_9AGAM|nr:chaperone for protein-folding within the ER, fungal-domain-containing protein [Russula earlei]